MYKRTDKSFFKHFDFFVLDNIVMQIAFTISYVLRHGLVNPYGDSNYLHIAMLISALMICVGFMTEGYTDILKRDYLVEFKKCAKMVSIVCLLLVAFMFVVQNSAIYSRYAILMTWFIGLYLVYMEHIVWKSVLIARIRRRSVYRQVMLVATTLEMAEEVIKDFESQKIHNFCVACIAIPEKRDKPEKLRDIPVLSGADNAIQYISDNVIDEVFAYTTIETDIPEWFIEDCLNMGVVVHQNLKEQLPYDVQQEISKMGTYTVLTASVNSATERQLFLKRTMDIVGSVLGLIFTGLFFLIVAPVIKIQSPGPVIFKQKRVGKNGRQFNIYKFRSMCTDAEEKKAELMEKNKMQGPISKFHDDPRIFPFGRFMRKYSIDELPQFWNVLRGDMSLVGTRPPTLDEYEQYELHHKKRLAAKPGLTGMWQVSGRNNVSDFEEIIQLDAQYISNWTLAMDMKILCRTLIAVLRRKGAG